LPNFTHDKDEPLGPFSEHERDLHPGNRGVVTSVDFLLGFREREPLDEDIADARQLDVARGRDPNLDLQAAGNSSAAVDRV
jgi:hypothetical protein